MKKFIFVILVVLFVSSGLPLYSVQNQRNVDFVDASIAGDYAYMNAEMRRGMKIDTPRGGRDYSTALMFAVGRQDMKMINFCLRYRASVNRRDPGGDTPLMLAAATGNQTIVNLLLRKGAAINSLNHGKESALSVAAVNNNLAMMRLLLKRGARRGKNLSLIYAAKASNPDMIKLLLRYGASVYYEHREHGTALYMAVSTGNIDSVRTILAKNRSLVNRAVLARNGGITPLARAAMMGDITMMKYLMSRGASKHYKNREGVSLLFMARPRAVLFLLSKGLSPKLKDTRGETLLQRYCSTRGHVDLRVAKELIRRGENVRGKNKYGQTFLMGAAANGKLDLVKLLVKSGANINVSDSRGNTAVAYALRGGYRDVEKYLLSKGGNPAKVRFPGKGYSYKKQNSEVATMVQAMYENNTSVVEQIVATGIKITARDYRGRSALDEAVNLNNFKMVKWLVKRGAAAEKRACNTAFIYASRHDIKLVKQLLAQGADIHTNGGAAFLSAVFNNKTDIKNLLLQKGILNAETKLTLSRALKGKAQVADYKSIKLLVKYGADCTGSYGGKALVFAAQNRGSYFPLKIIKLLISKGADKNYKTSYGRTALDSAEVIKNYKLIAYMKKAGFVKGRTLYKKRKAQTLAQKKDDIKKLMQAVYDKDINRVKALVKSGISINSQDNNGWTVLHNAAATRQWKIVPELLKLGVNKNIKSRYRKTAREVARQRNNWLFIKALDGKNIDPGDEKKLYPPKKKKYTYEKKPLPPKKKKGFYRDFPESPDKNKKKTVPVVYKGLILYGNPNCGRCIGFKRKLSRENVKYTFINVRQNRQANSRMWRLMRKGGFNARSVSFPILELNGKVLWPDRKKHFTARGVFWVDKYYADYLRLKKN